MKGAIMPSKGDLVRIVDSDFTREWIVERPVSRNSIGETCHVMDVKASFTSGSKDNLLYGTRFGWWPIQCLEKVVLSDVEKVKSLGQSLHGICGALDEQKVLLASLLQTWVNSANATTLIQAMSHIDEAIRICEAKHGEIAKAMVVRASMGEDREKV
jgi:hypothetical protein